MEFDAQRAADRIVCFIRGFFDRTGGRTAVVGLSGGKDSAITAALCAKALGKENVLGVILPDREMPDMKEAMDAAGRYCGLTIGADIGRLVGVFRDLSFGLPRPSVQADINLPARLRMVVLYYAAQCSEHGRVANTCNLSENYVGWATRYGDSAGDFAPLHDLTVQEVKAVGHAIGVPYDLVEKVPSDGLCGRTDEDAFGFTYEVLDRYIRTGVCDDPVIKDRIDNMHAASRFKEEPIPYPAFPE